MQGYYQPLRGRSPHSAPSEPQTAVIALHCNGRERDGTVEKVNFQQILGKTFLSLLPLSALFKHYGLPVLSSRPFESLSRRRGWNASPTKPWLMFKEKIMEIQCRDHTREIQQCFLLLRNMTK